MAEVQRADQGGDGALAAVFLPEPVLYEAAPEAERDGLCSAPATKLAILTVVYLRDSHAISLGILATSSIGSEGLLQISCRIVRLVWSRHHQLTAAPGGGS